jgi:hypothetical protein
MAPPGPPPAPGFQPPGAYVPAAPRGGGKAIASLVLGIASLVAWLLPVVGIPVAITGLVLGLLDRRSRNRGLAIGGIVTATIGLVAGLINSAAGVYLKLTGQM